MPELKPLKNFRIKRRQREYLEQELLTELYEIEKKIAKSRKEHDEVGSPVFKRCAPISEKKTNWITLFSSIALS
jgi:hypothetical protein